MTHATRELKERYATLFEQVPIGVFVFDRALVLTECNSRLIEILRSTRERLIGLDMGKLRDQSVVPGMHAALRGENAYYEGPYFATTSDTTVRISLRFSPLRNEANEVVSGMGVVEDITERSAAVEALRRSEAQFRLLIERAPDVILVVDSQFKVAYANASCASAVGACEVGRDFFSLVASDEDRASLLASMRTPSLPDASLTPIEARFSSDSSRRAHLEVVVMPIEYDGRAATLVLGRDVTERKVMQARLMQADRMVAMGTLAAGVAHEINNPLAYLSANLDLLAKRKLPEMRSLFSDIFEQIEVKGEAQTTITESFSRCVEMLDIAREGASRVKDIVRDLRTFSRDDERRTAVDVRSVLDACVNIAHSELRENATIVREYGDVPQTQANESRLGQVFLNLIVNAAQAMKTGKPDENSIILRAFTSPSGTSVVVEIADTGTGIPDDVRAHIFDPFYTTKPAGVGTGLGLFICRGIIGGLGGTIEIKESSLRGTTFRVTLPLEGAPVAIASEPNPARASGPDKHRVLFVDDETALGDAIAAALDDEFIVTVSFGGRDALERISRGERYAAIVCDLMMPDMTGMDLFAAVKDAWPELCPRFVFITGAAFSARAREFLASNTNTKLEKPFDTSTLREALGSLIFSLAHAAS